VFAVAVEICLLGYLFLSSMFRDNLLVEATAVIFLAGACFGLNVCFLRAEGRSVASIGFGKPALRMKQFGIAFAAGGMLILGWALIVIGLSSSHWRWQAAGFNGGAVASLLVFYLFNNAAEELAYRGYAFLRLEEAYGRTVAIIGTSLVFALMHVQGGVPWLNAMAGVLTTSLIFGILFSRWKSLPLVLGFHVATTVMQDVLGLRQRPLSLLQLEGGSVAGGRGLMILCAVAFLNLVVFAAFGGFKRVLAHGHRD
jgi:membrane protease YdiL (CAAX protease family)